MMPPPTSPKKTIQAYYELADRLFEHREVLESLPQTSHALPLLTPEWLVEIAHRADEAALSEPRYGWVLTAVADAAARCTQDVALQAYAAWYMARAANAWVRPDLVDTAVARTRDLLNEVDLPELAAACDWIENAEPWTRPNFTEARDKLETAVAALEAADKPEWVYQCRLSLAFAQMLTGQSEAAINLLDKCQVYFKQNEQTAYEATCFLHLASIKRRQLNYPQSSVFLEKSRILFESAHSSMGLSRVSYQLGIVAFYQEANAKKGLKIFQELVSFFQQKAMPLWEALSQNLIIQIYNNIGELLLAYNLQSFVHTTFEQFNVLGSLADHLIDAAITERNRGDYIKALTLLKEAKEIASKAGNQDLAILALTYEGDLLALQGQYHQGLHCLEKALLYRQEKEDVGRQCDCLLRIARLLSCIGKQERAYKYLESTLANFEEAGRGDNLLLLYHQMGLVLFYQGNFQKAIAYLKKALQLAYLIDWPYYVGFVKRDMAQILTETANYDEAIELLNDANNKFKEIGAIVEQGLTLVYWGNSALKGGKLDEALRLYQDALVVTDGLSDVIYWQASAGIARCKLQTHQIVQSLENYLQAIERLHILRKRLRQPQLSSSFFLQVKHVFDEAISLSIEVEMHPEAWVIIEQAKGQTWLNQVVQPENDQHPAVQRSRELRAEIDWLQSKLSRTTAPRNISHTQETQWRQRLVSNLLLYRDTMEQVERSVVIETSTDKILGLPTDLHILRTEVNAAYKKWLFVNFYLTEEYLFGAYLSDEDIRSWRYKLTDRDINVLRPFTTNRISPPQLSLKQVEYLGKILFPDWLQDILIQNLDAIIIAPHNDLFRLPWSAIWIKDHPLVYWTVPTIVPSFSIWWTLIHRNIDSKKAPRKILLTAIDTFEKDVSDLPYVREERNVLRHIAQKSNDVSCDLAVTWVDLQNSLQKINAYDVWHIATHIQPDSLTGRFSNIVLTDRSILLDDLWQLGYLPTFVIFSSCSGIHLFLHDGDEPVGLAATCLAAGAQMVLGNQWQVEDRNVATMMKLFYENWTKQKHCAQALAAAQREAYKRGVPTEIWGGFICLGVDEGTSQGSI